MGKVTHTAFDSSHPSVAIAYFCGMAGLTMFCMQPALAAISLAGALLFGACVCGLPATLRGLRWQLPMVAVVALANPLFSASGSTLLLRVGPMAIYLESVCYGACAGCVLAAAIAWLSCAAEVVTQDRLLAVAGSRAPVVALMVSMAARLVPQLVRRGNVVTSVDRVVTAPAAKDGVPARGRGLRGLRSRVASAATVSGALVGWSLSDSLDAADSMRARGWGAVPDRASYQPWAFRPTDALALAGVVCLVGGCALLGWVACSQFRFYPTMSVLLPWWGYAPYALMSLLPSILHAKEAISWRS